MLSFTAANLTEVSCLDNACLPTSGSTRKFHLKKRKAELPTALSNGFLSGLFDDLRAQQSEDIEAEKSNTPATATTTANEALLDQSVPNKRSRVSLLTKTLSRCAGSCKNFSSQVSSPAGVDDFGENDTTVTSYFTEPSYCSPSMERMNSLHFQLNCVDASPSPKSVKSVVDIIDMAFPHLPATVSDSSCSRAASPKPQQQQDLTRGSDQQVSESETFNSISADDVASGKDTYGWFVDLDSVEEDSDHSDSVDPYQRNTSSLDLAFTAPTAPKRISNVEAEVEWAKAADTVDDVLGDFF